MKPGKIIRFLVLFSDVMNSGNIRRNLFILFSPLLLTMMLYSRVFGQTIVDSIVRPELAAAGMAVYEKGNKLCVFDDRSNHLLIYNCTTLALKKEIIFHNSICDPFSCIGMAVNETEGKLYACLGHENWPEKWVMIAIIDLIGDSLLTEIPVPGLLPQSANGFVYDSEIKKIFLLGWHNNAFIVDLSNNTVTQINIDATHIAVNLITHEVFLSVGTEVWILNHLTHQLSFGFDVGGTQVYDMTISSIENKIYLITVAPYTNWIYDRDDGSVKELDDLNDSGSLFFSPGANMVYTSAEIACRSTVIDCKTDNWFYLPMEGGIPSMGFRHSTKHAYFVGSYFIAVFDEANQMMERIDFNHPHAEKRSGTQYIAVNQTTGQVFVTSVSLYDPPNDNPIWVLQDSEMMTRSNVILGGQHVVTVIDPENYAFLNCWEVLSGTGFGYKTEGSTYNPNGGRAYIARHGSYGVAQISVHMGCGAADKYWMSAGDFDAIVGYVDMKNLDPITPVSSPDGSRIYVTCSAKNQVQTIDVSADSNLFVINKIAVGKTPWGAALTPDGTRLYVANKGSNNVSIVNTTTATTIDSISVGTAPWGVAINPGGTLVYVANSGSNSVSVIDINTNTVIATISVGLNPHWLCFTPDGKYIFVSNNASGTISVIDAGTHKVVQTIGVGNQPEGICFYPDGTRAYVATATGASIINSTTYSVTSFTEDYYDPYYSVSIANPTSRFAGRVQNGNYQPVANAVIKVFLDGIEKGTAITNASGDYSVFNLKNETYNIEVTAQNYNPQSLTSQSVDIGRTKINHLNLTPFPPEIPLLVSPLNNSVRQFLNDTLLWDESPVVYTYHLQLSLDSFFQVLVYNDSTINDNSKLVGNLSSATKYYWRVKAKNESGNSAWSEGWNFTTTSSTGVTEIGVDSQTKIYPNPATDKFTVEFEFLPPRNADLEVSDLSGRTMFFKKLQGLKSDIDVSALPVGIYIARIRNGESIFYKKITIQ